MGWASLRKQAQQQSVSLIRVSNDAALIARGVTSVEGQKVSHDAALIARGVTSVEGQKRLFDRASAVSAIAPIATEPLHCGSTR